MPPIEKRQFVAEDAVPSASSLLIGLSGASGGGKTFSALRLATGIQRVFGGEIYYIDTDNRRALHYARQFKFKHVNFEPPFSSDAYVQAIEYAERQGAGVIVVDSGSHEHEGEGGLLDAHEAELNRMVPNAGDYRKREAMKMLAWAAPKAARRRFILKLQRLRIPTIICFRAKESAKPVRTRQEDGSVKTEVVAQGFRPIAGDELVFEMTLNALLFPNSGGVATWESATPGEAQMIKLPEQFKTLRTRTAPLDEDLGENFAKWARGPTGAKALPEPKGSPPAAEEPPASEPTAEADERPSAPPQEPEDDFPGDRPGPAAQAGLPLDPPAETREARQARERAELEARQAERGFSTTDQGPGAEAELEPAAPPEPGFGSFVDDLVDTKSWADIQPLLQALMKSFAWKEADDALRNKARALSYRRWRELRDAGRDKGVDFVSVPHLFRGYIEAETDLDALVGNWRVAKAQPEFRALGDQALEVFERAVNVKLAALAPPPKATPAAEFE